MLHVDTPVLTLRCSLPREAMQLLPALTLLAIGERLEGLYLSTPSDYDSWNPRLTTRGWHYIEAEELLPLAALSQLITLHIDNVDGLWGALASTLRRLTALKELSLSTQIFHGSHQPGPCEVFDVAATAMPHLESLSVAGCACVGIERLPAEMSRLTNLWHLDIRDVRIERTCDVLTTLTGLERLIILRESDLPAAAQPQPANPLPAGMSALSSLWELRATCYHQPMPPLELPALEVLQLDAPPPAGEVWPPACVHV